MAPPRPDLSIIKSSPSPSSGALSYIWSSSGSNTKTSARASTPTPGPTLIPNSLTSKQKLLREKGAAGAQKEDQESKDPCLQCHLLGLKCLFSSWLRWKSDPAFSNKPNSVAKNGREVKTARCCERCKRNGEDFCIIQTVEGGLNWRRIEQTVTYSSDGVDTKLVMERARELEEREGEKWKFAPKVKEGWCWGREFLQPVSRRWGGEAEESILSVGRRKEWEEVKEAESEVKGWAVGRGYLVGGEVENGRAVSKRVNLMVN